MSDRGSILISTANDIGEALVEKLGGEGYAPSVWDKEYNKLGIAEVDSAPALSVLDDSSETGTARGSILLSTANAIGAVLNKKYYTDRGFKPKEWASAASKLAPLPEKSAESSPICAIEDGADDVPSRSLVVTIPPTLTGESQIIEKRSGRNLINANDDSKTFSANVITNYDVASLELKKGITYTFSAYQDTAITGSTRNTLRITFDGNYTYESTGTNYHNQAGIHYMSITPAQDGVAVFAILAHTPNEDITYSKFMVEYGSTASDYVPYEEPTTYTADLGRTINGGTADIVNGTGSDNCTNRDLVGEGFTWSYNTTELSFPYFTIGSNAPNKAANKNFVCEGYVNRGNYRSFLQDGEIGVFNNTTGINRFCIRDDSCTTLEQFLEKNANTKITYEVTNPVEFTFDGQEIPTKDGYNAFWSDQGNTALDYYGEPEPYTRGTASGAIANVQSARTDLPFTMVKANIAPNLTGVESVEVTKCGVNLFDKTTITPNTWIIVNSTDTESTVGYKTSGYIPVKANTRYYVSAKGSNRTAYYDRNKNGIAYFALSGGAAFTCLYDGYIRLSIKDDVDLDTFIVNEGNEAIAYEPYKGTIYTADLGEPVYGGYADLVSGEVVKDCTKGSMSSTYLSGLNSDYIGYEASTAYFNNHPSIWVRNWNYQTAAPRVSGGIKCDCNEFPVSMHNTTIFSAQYRINFDVYGKNITSVQDFIDYVEDLEQNGKSLDIAYEVADPTESSITPQVISPSEGVNNLWNNAGGDTDVEYFTQE